MLIADKIKKWTELQQELKKKHNVLEKSRVQK